VFRGWRRLRDRCGCRPQLRRDPLGGWCMHRRSGLALVFGAVATLWSSAPARLLWPGPQPGDPIPAVTAGLAMNHGLAGIGFAQAIPRTPVVVGIGGSPAGYAGHVDVALPRLRYRSSLFA